MDKIIAKVEEIKSRKEVKRVTRIESRDDGYRIYFEITKQYAKQHELSCTDRVYEYNAISAIKEMEFADTQIIHV